VSFHRDQRRAPGSRRDLIWFGGGATGAVETTPPLRVSERKKLSVDVQAILDSQTETWGIKVSNVEIRPDP
jgi:hypothetical protein